MIDWGLVARHAVWISGAALALAAWSFGRSEGFTQRSRAAAALDLFLTSIGFALVTPLWQALIWLAIALFIAVRMWQALEWRQKS